MKIAIATAMESEWTRIKNLMDAPEKTVFKGRHFYTGTVGRNEVVLGETGIGKVNAAIGAMRLIEEFKPDCMISVGVAGGLDSSLRVMDVVAAAEVAYHDVDCGPGNEYGQVQGFPARFTADRRLLQHAKATPVEGARLVAGLLASGDRFIAKPAQLAVIKSKFPKALAVDMESGALAQVCHIFGVPFLSFRILSDTPHGMEDRFSQYTNFWDTIAERAFGVSHVFLESLPPKLEDISAPPALSPFAPQG